MHYSFKLKYPNRNKDSLIYFTSFFKDEGKSFVYSTGERVRPENWDFENRKPINLSGKDKEVKQRKLLEKELNKFSSAFIEIVNRAKSIDEDITIETVREEFNKVFAKSTSKINDFFKVYDLFLADKLNDKSDNANRISTIKRYKYNRKLFEQFSEKTKFNLRFNNINKDFYNQFIEFSVTHKKHSANTLSRNVGLLKTFLNWALRNKYTYNDQFKEFKNIKKFSTDEIALTLKDVKEIMNIDLSNKKKYERVRDLFVFGCATGMRYGNYSKVRKKDVYNGFINIIDIKDETKHLSIPLNELSEKLLLKYDYCLPSLSNQKFNEYLKELFEFAGYTELIKKTMRYGNDLVETTSPVFSRISSHTARRSFITIMKNNHVPDKVIMSYTGHKNLPNFNIYYKPNDNQRIKFMHNVWN